jgi:ARC6-like, IMS domain
MEQITVTFQKHDGSDERTLPVLLDDKLGEVRQDLQTLLGLSDKQYYRIVLLENGQLAKEINDNQTFREAKIKDNDRLALFPLDVWQEQKIKLNEQEKSERVNTLKTDVSTQPKTSQEKNKIEDTSTYETRFAQTSMNRVEPQTIISATSPKNWLNAVIIGGLIGGAIIIGFAVTINPKLVQPLGSFSSSQPASSITKENAVELIKRWQSAKKEIFSSPFNRRLAAELITGQLHDETLKPDGSLDWLQKNGAYYRYGVQSLDSVEQFLANGDNASIEVIITEERTYYKKDGNIDRDNTAFDTRLVRYTLQSENGQLKIAAYTTVKTIRKS